MAVKDGLPSTDFSRMNREYIKAVAEGGSGGGGLPEITEADEGKVLTVESGEAAWATAGGGGGGVFVVTAAPIPDDPDEKFILNKTWTEINDAMDDGEIVIIHSKIEFLDPDTTIIANDFVTSSQYDSSGPSYLVNCLNGVFVAATASDYPVTYMS